MEKLFRISVVSKMKSKLFLSALLCTLLNGYVNAEERIYGGYKIDITQAPYMVTVAVALETYADGSTKVYNCGGTILRTNLILSAGHCKFFDAVPAYSTKFLVFFSCLIPFQR